MHFPAPLPVDTRVQAWSTLLAAVEHPLGVMTTRQIEVEAEGLDKPVCVAEQLTLRFL